MVLAALEAAVLAAVEVEVEADSDGEAVVDSADGEVAVLEDEVEVVDEAVAVLEDEAAAEVCKKKFLWFLLLIRKFRK